LRGKRRGLLGGIFLFLTGILIYQLNFPVPVHWNNNWNNVRVHLHQEYDNCQNYKFKLKMRNSAPDSCLAAAGSGQKQIALDLFRLISLRDTAVSIVPQVKVVPGGQSIGVLLHSKGVIVVGYSAIQEQSGNKVNPSVDAGISVGDIILKINNEDVKSEGQVRDMVTRAGTSGQPLNLEVKHGTDIFYTKINPVYCTETSRYRIGLLIKDSAAGLGTLTFYEPESMTYGALGHVITDIGSAQPFNLSDGRIVGASIQAIHRGKRGQPGEKIGIFQDDKKINGTISKNTKLGIFGNLQKPLENANQNMLKTVAPANQIHEGKAEILTVLKDEQVEKFSVEILKLNLNAVHDGKGIIIKITDPRLLEQTGGIIQGMSGSPIIQDDKLVGAITHVFVNDPTRGYGVPVEWMLREAEILPMEKNYKIAS